MYNLFMSSIHA